MDPLSGTFTEVYTKSISHLATTGRGTSINISILDGVRFRGHQNTSELSVCYLP